MKKWAIRMHDGGPYTHYDNREQARAAAKRRSRFDDCAYHVYKRAVSKHANTCGEWQHVETHDFHQALRAALT